MTIRPALRTLALPSALALAVAVPAHAADDVYAGFPVTVKGYDGEATTSVSYSGQIARHVLHDSLKKLAGQGNGEPSPQLEARMMAYFSGKEPGREILAPRSKGGFVIAQTLIDEISKNRDLASKTFPGPIAGWPGNRTGAEVVEFWIGKAAAADGGFDPLTGYNYPQLISKFIMGALSYNQAVDHYLGTNLARDRKRNDEPYKEGAPYTGKEHIWDEAFGYFGAPAHALRLSPEVVYAIAKTDEKIFPQADHDGDGKVDLKTEMTFGPAYYAADADKSGKTRYLETITQAFLDGRKLLASAGGEALTDAQYARLVGYADTIKSNWEKVLAEAVFKYAGSVYLDLKELQQVIAANGDASKPFAAYGKHWGELKGFMMALHSGGSRRGGSTVELLRLVGYGPVLLGGGQVTGIDADGEYVITETVSMGEYMTNMLQIQKIMVEDYGVMARKNDALSGMAELIKKVGEKKAAETD